MSIIGKKLKHVANGQIEAGTSLGYFTYVAIYVPPMQGSLY